MSIEQLWHGFFSDPLQWSDKRTPDCRHNHTKEVLWIENWSKPPWVKSELAACQAQRGDVSDVDIHHGAPGQAYNRKAGVNQAQLVVGQKFGGRDSTVTIITSIEKERQEGHIEDSSCACGVVRELCKAGRLKEALHILNNQRMRADSNTYLSLLQECIKMKGLAEGMQVHAHIVQSGFKPSIFLLSTLVKMYAKCGSVVAARRVFDKMSQRDLCTWTIMMAGYAKHGHTEEAFKMYEQMQREGVMPDRVTFICVLNVCASLGALQKGKDIHSDIIKAGIVSYVNLENSLVDMYAKCGSMRDAHHVFDNMAKPDVVSWNAMITGYAQHGCGREAFNIYEQMQQQGVKPDRVTFVCVINACASLGALEMGKVVHGDIIKTGIAPYINLETALVDMYAKCGSMRDAQQVFDSMAKRNVVSWSVMIAGYAQHGCGREAVQIYEQMQQEGVKPNKVTFICVLNACSSLGALEKGREVHGDIIKTGTASYLNLETALIDMYAKCGSMKDSHQVFDNIAKRDVVLWNAMIAGCAQHGCGREALQLFEQLQQEGLKPDGITFTSLLVACNHVGLVDEGCHYFDSMSHAHGLIPRVEHFGCMVDLLGRAGQLDAAEDYINRMPIKPDAFVWMALLGACKIHGDVERAERAANALSN